MIAYLVTRNGEYQHTVSKRKLEKLQAEGWKLVVTLDGWNISIQYPPKRE